MECPLEVVPGAIAMALDYGTITVDPISQELVAVGGLKVVGDRNYQMQRAGTLIRVRCL